MFRFASILVIAAAVLTCLVHLTTVRPRNRVQRAPRELRRYSIWERLIHLAVTGSFAAVAVTGFWPAWPGQRLTSWRLMIHAGAGAVFAVAMAAMAVRWAHECRLSQAAPKFGPCQKTLFWFAVASGLVTTLTMMVSMTPLFGPEGLEALLAVHQWSALALLAAIIVHAYLQTLGRPGTWQAMLDGKVSRVWAEKFRPEWLAERSSTEKEEE